MGITSNTNSQYPMNKFSPFYPNSGTKSNFNLMQQKNQVVAATVTATEESELEQDQTVLYFDTLHKLTFLTQMLPRSSLNKDLRLVQLETFYQCLMAPQKQSITESLQRPESVFSGGAAPKEKPPRQGVRMKVEIGKLITCSRDPIFDSGGNQASNISILKNTTYEKLNQQMEDLLRENGYY